MITLRSEFFAIRILKMQTLSPPGRQWRCWDVALSGAKDQTPSITSPCSSSTVRWALVGGGRGVSLPGLESHLHHWKAKPPRVTASLPCALVVSSVMRSLTRCAIVRMK